MTEKLKKCPFCGGKAERVCTNLCESMVGHPARYTIMCKKCRTRLGGEYNSEVEAIEAWNRRAE